MALRMLLLAPLASLLLLLALAPAPTAAQEMQDLYCGDMNCYEGKDRNLLS